MKYPNLVFLWLLIATTICAIVSCELAYGQSILGNMIIKKGYNEVFPDKTVIHQPWGATGTKWIGDEYFIYNPKVGAELSEGAKDYWFPVFFDKLNFGNQLEYYNELEFGTLIGGTGDEIALKVEGLLALFKASPFGYVFNITQNDTLYKLERGVD